MRGAQADAARDGLAVPYEPTSDAPVREEKVDYEAIAGTVPSQVLPGLLAPFIPPELLGADRDVMRFVAEVDSLLVVAEARCSEELRQKLALAGYSDFLSGFLGLCGQCHSTFRELVAANEEVARWFDKEAEAARVAKKRAAAAFSQLAAAAVPPAAVCDEPAAAVGSAASAALERLQKAIAEASLTYEVGEVAEVVILDDVDAGTWLRCLIQGPGDEPGCYNIFVLPTTGPGGDFSDIEVPNMSVEHMRKLTPAAEDGGFAPPPRPGLRPGDQVVVQEALLSNSKEKVQLAVGQEGLVDDVDADGDALIDFKDHQKKQWVAKRNLHKLVKIGASASQAAIQQPKPAMGKPAMPGGPRPAMPAGPKPAMPGGPKPAMPGPTPAMGAPVTGPKPASPAGAPPPGPKPTSLAGAPPPGPKPTSPVGALPPGPKPTSPAGAPPRGPKATSVGAPPPGPKPTSPVGAPPPGPKPMSPTAGAPAPKPTGAPAQQPVGAAGPKPSAPGPKPAMPPSAPSAKAVAPPAAARHPAVGDFEVVDDFRDADVYDIGELAEVAVLDGPAAGSWLRCRIIGDGRDPGTYNIYVLPVAGAAADFSDMKVPDMSPDNLRRPAES